MILIKDRMTKKLGFTPKSAANDFNRLGTDGRGIEIEHRQQNRDVLHCLVEREADGMIVDFAKVDAMGSRAVEEVIGSISSKPDSDCVEERTRMHRPSTFFECSS